MNTPTPRKIPVARVAPPQSDSGEDDRAEGVKRQSIFHIAGFCLMIVGGTFAVLALIFLSEASSLSKSAPAWLLFGQCAIALFLAGCLFLVAGALLRGRPR